MKFAKLSQSLLLLSLGIVTVPGQAAIPTAGACLNWRWIGVMAESTATCPTPVDQNWSTRRLFAASVAQLGPSLARFCVYEYKPDMTPPAAPAFVGVGLQRLDRDCVAVSPLADPTRLDGVQWNSLWTHLQTQAGATAGSLIGTQPVRLAVIDTNPTNPFTPEFDVAVSPHGNALVNFADRLLCGLNASCAARVTSRLALSYRAVNPNKKSTGDVSTDGGYVGSISELAEALNGEVIDWRQSSQSSRLVINLSVGWDSAFGGLEQSVINMPASVQAVHAALVDASCRGALVFAASGNHTAGTDFGSGPMLPAAWEQRAALGFQACVATLGSPTGLLPSTFNGSSYRPLLYAVSGIESDGSSLDNARIGGIARLAAYADHTISENANLGAGVPTVTLTGSSVAALLASTNATLAWSWNSTLGPNAVADLIYGAAMGTPSVLGRNADFCLGRNTSGNSCSAGHSAQVHRLSLCATHAVVAPGAPPPSACVWDTADADLKLDYSAFDAAATVVDLASHVRWTGISGCGNLLVHSVKQPAGSDVGCPHLSLPSIGALPWVAPQPGSDLCPPCEFGDPTAAQRASENKLLLAPEVLRVQIADGVNGGVRDISLLLGGAVIRIDPGYPLQGGDALLITGVENFAGDRDAALLTYSVAGKMSAISTVLRGR